MVRHIYWRERVLVFDVWHKSLQDSESSTPDERERMSGILYASAIGSIIYATLCICPDVFHALSVTSGYQMIQVRVTGSRYGIFSSILAKEVFLVNDKKGMSLS